MSHHNHNPNHNYNYKDNVEINLRDRHQVMNGCSGAESSCEMTMMRGHTSSWLSSREQKLRNSDLNNGLALTLGGPASGHHHAAS